MTLSLLLLAPLVQDPAPQAQPPETWWRQLPAEERERIHQRWRRFQDLPPENREAIRRRFRTLEEERTLLWRRLDETERLRVEGLPEDARRRFLDERVRERLRERGANLERRAPRSCQRLRALPPDERMRVAPEVLKEAHAEKAREELERAVAEGWLGEAAAAWLRQAPPDDVLAAVGQVHRWRFLQRAEADGFWRRHGVAPEARARLLELPAPLFFDEVRRIERGEAPLGPPSDWRGEGPPRRRAHER